jgi:Xaa-Pro aminopeptidase
MFQKFESLSRPETARDRVIALRSLFDDLGVDAILVPKNDEYLGEYIPLCAERLTWLTSFTGSAGSALILRDSAIAFTDGRYTSQIINQCDASIFTFEDMVSTPPSQWIKDNGSQKLRVGLDPWTLPSASVKKLQDAIDHINGTLVMLDDNPIDTIWQDQPNQPLEPVSIQPFEIAGQLTKDKIALIKSDLSDSNTDAVIIADPLSIAWIFNIRGNDIAHNPVPLARAIINKDGEPTLFIDKRKLGIEVEAYLNQLADLRPPSEFDDGLKELGKAQTSVQIDPNSSSHAISMILIDNGAQTVEAVDPASLPRAIKNKAELKGSVHAHIVDGAAMVTFIAWLKSQQPSDLTEIDVATKLEETRAFMGKTHQCPLKDISFDTISGSGPNAAIIHYRVNEDSNRNLQDGEMLLVDSGGQYVSGTTDITRTIGLGKVPDDQKRYFTLVLKGMIDISLLRFPQGTRGVDIDAFARVALWKSGLDYGHGTGHGVGSYLAVHEGPQSISKRAMVEFQAGMILSNEPGYYRDDAFGIRIENLVYVHEARDIENGEQRMLGFQTLTLCPIDKDLIVQSMLTKEQLEWFDAYHKRVFDELSPLIKDENTQKWLTQATQPL